MRDALTRREPREFIQKILRFVKDVDITFVKNQLNFIYINLDLELRRDIKKLEVDIIVNSFLNALNEYKYF